ncbi:histone H4 transcription factor isoform X1 [Hydra vulgaris]|uniref:histone H4 transcription factor isoform X1 n=1 Tax=Hydra vulgaris TaxID=6087 RepID=UPI001F5F5B5C|nr:histone H4 transcription factor isoform X1 [Hydra vulgaris]
MATKPKVKRKNEKIVQIHCEWENCESIVTLQPLEYETFSAHLKEHADEFILRLKEESDLPDEKPLSCCCMWRGCSWEGCEDLMELTRHIMFHGYHSLLRALGKLEQDKMSLNDCLIEQEDQYHMLSCVTTPFLCLWNNCAQEHCCPDKFYRHVEKHVLNSDSICDENNKYRMQCYWNTCSNTFRDKHKLKEHVRVHTHEKLVACPGCGGLFSNRTKLLDHLSRQNTQAYENFQCSHCLKRCASERLLRDHMRHHVNYLKCPHCDMTCPNPGSLKYHIHYRHSDERPYPCAMCDHSFKSNSDLVRHEESHLPKSYICTVTGCSFTTKTSHCLKRHMKITHSENGTKRYICHICNHAYSRGFGLTKHLKKKHNFNWPAGHPRFRYIEYEDGFFRLQMVRFESVELTKRLETEDGNEVAEEEEEDSYEVETLYDGIIEVSNNGDINIDGNIEVTYDPTLGILCAVNKENTLYEKEVSNEVEIECEVRDGDEDELVLEKDKDCTGKQSIPENHKDCMDTDIANIHNEQLSNNIETKNIYLQPKPAGFDMSVMAQLVALSSGKHSVNNVSEIDNASDATDLVSHIYKQILKASKTKTETSDNFEDEMVLATRGDQDRLMFEKITTQESAINDEEHASSKEEGDDVGDEEIDDDQREIIQQYLDLQEEIISKNDNFVVKEEIDYIKSPKRELESKNNSPHKRLKKYSKSDDVERMDASHVLLSLKTSDD